MSEPEARKQFARPFDLTTADGKVLNCAELPGTGVVVVGHPGEGLRAVYRSVEVMLAEPEMQGATVEQPGGGETEFVVRLKHGEIMPRPSLTLAQSSVDGRLNIRDDLLARLTTVLDDGRCLIPAVQAEAVLAALLPELDELMEYRSAICWETSCLSCSRMLDACRKTDEKTEQAAAEHARVLAQLLADWSREATPLHDKLARITLAAWNPDVDGNSFRELVRAVVGPVIRSGLDDPEYLATLRAECRRLGLPVADTAEEKVQRVRDVLARYDVKFYEDFVIALDGPEAIPSKTGCRTNQHCAYHGWCHRCDPERAAASRKAKE